MVNKAITSGETEPEKDENGMEIMNLAEVEGGADSTGQQLSVPPQMAAIRRPPIPVSKKLDSKQPAHSPQPDVTCVAKGGSVSPTPSKNSGRASPTAPRSAQPNLVLPSWQDTFCTAPRSVLPPPPSSALKKTFNFVTGMFFPRDEGVEGAAPWKSKGKEKSGEKGHFGKALPRSWNVMGESLESDVLRGCKRVVVIGIHGWFPGT